MADKKGAVEIGTPKTEEKPDLSLDELSDEEREALSKLAEAHNVEPPPAKEEPKEEVLFGFCVYQSKSGQYGISPTLPEAYAAERQPQADEVLAALHVLHAEFMASKTGQVTTQVQMLQARMMAEQQQQQKLYEKLQNKGAFKGAGGLPRG